MNATPTPSTPAPNRGWLRTPRFATACLASAVALVAVGGLSGCESGSVRGGDSPAAKRSADDGGTDVNKLDTYPGRTGTTMPMSGNGSMDGANGMNNMNGANRSTGTSNSTGRMGGRTVPTNGGVETTLAYPTGNEETSVLLLKAVTPAQVRVGESFQYIITVTNLLADTPVHGVTVMDFGNGATDVNAATPPKPLLELGTLAPGQSVTRNVPATITEAPANGTVANCLSVTYDPTMCVMVTVVNPQIQLVKSGPAEVSVCDPITYTYAVTNTGTGAASNVVVTDELPAGLTLADGSTSVNQSVGDIGPGETKTASVTVQPAKAGTYASAAVAKSASSTVNSEPVSTQVKSEELSLAIQAPETEYAGQNVNYNLFVKNTGEVPVQNVKIDISVDGTNEQATRTVDAIAVGDTATVPVSVSAGQAAGQQTLNVKVQSPCPAVNGPAAAATVNIKSISALQIEVVDKADPVRVGDNPVYTIRVLNQGSADEKDVSLTATLPDQEDYVSGEGASAVTADGKKVNLAPVNIPAKQSVEWTVTTKATAAGDVRFDVNLMAPTLTTPVLEQEPTKLYDPNAGGVQRVEGKPQPAPALPPAPGAGTPPVDPNK